MGWLLIRKRAKQFEQQTDAAMDGDVLQPTLFSNVPVACSHSYECVPEPGAPSAQVGIPVVIIDAPGRMDIYHGTQPVGQVDPAHAALLRKKHGIAKKPGKSVTGTIVHVSGLTNSFKVDVPE